MTAPKTKTKIMTRRIATGLALVISLSLSGAGAEPPEDGDASLAAHVLNRITFGPRPGDIERVAEMGIAAFIEEQLQPAAIDDGALERQLSGFETLELDTADLIERYHLPAFMALRDRRRAAMADTPTDEPPRRPGQDLPPEVRQSRQPVIELTEQKLIRAVSSERQLQEVLVDFWFNHFNVSARKGLQIHPYLIEYERDVLRPHVLGNFRDLLGAVAESPAMLIYLDNWLSSDPDAEHPFTQEAIARRDDMTRGGGTPGNWRHLDRSQRRSWRQLADTVQGGPRNGLNENYARELLELHTLKRFSNRPCTTWGGRGTSARTDAGGPMRAYSMDLRERALLDSDAGMKAADMAAKYRVSGSWVRLLKQRRRDTGEVAPRVQRQGRRGMLEPHLHTLAALMAAHPDRTLAELKDALATAARVPTVWRAVRALGLTVKKTGPAVRTRSA